MLAGVNLSSGVNCALKRMQHSLLKQLDLDPLKEVSIMTALPAHRNIVKMHEVITTPKSTFVVFEMLSDDLAAFIRQNGCLSEHHARQIFVQMVQAVSHMHAHQIVHGDLKPENVCFCEGSNQQRIKIIDFGAAMVSNGNDISGLRGTPQYLPPEVCAWYAPEASPANYGKEIDIWSLGVTLFVMLSGRQAFSQDKSIQSLYADVSAGSYDLADASWEQVSTPAKDLIHQLLTVDPRKRPCISEIKTHPWLQEAKV